MREPGRLEWSPYVERERDCWERKARLGKEWGLPLWKWAPRLRSEEKEKNKERTANTIIRLDTSRGRESASLHFTNLRPERKERMPAYEEIERYAHGRKKSPSRPNKTINNAIPIVDNSTKSLHSSLFTLFNQNEIFSYDLFFLLHLIKTSRAYKSLNPWKIFYKIINWPSQQERRRRRSEDLFCFWEQYSHFPPEFILLDQR